MAVLVLVNGAPASGKSTLARAIAAQRPMLLHLDVDVVRHHLGRWHDQPHDAGLAARRLASSMAATHLHAGHDVVVPQFVARPEFVDQLVEVAAASEARFVHLHLVVDRQVAIERFHARAAAPASEVDADAATLLARSRDRLETLHDRLDAFVAGRTDVVPVQAGSDDVSANAAAVSAAIWPD